MTGKMNSAAPVPAAKRNWRWTRDDVDLGALGFPTFLWFVLFSYLPMFGLIIAFKDYRITAGGSFLSNLFQSEWVAFDNFKFFINNNTFGMLLRNTILYNLVFIALGISVLVTGVGTVLGLFLTTTMGYVLSRPVFKLKGFYTWVVFIPMIFNGGMLASYVINTNLLRLSDTVWALILPLAVSSFNIIVCKSFFRSTIPDAIIESAKIDGAAQLRIFGQIVLPISKPVLATIALFMVFGYWNDWFQSSLYITDSRLLSLQALLNNMMRNLEYIANNPTVGVSLQQYRNSMPSESVRMAIAVVIVIPIACAYPFFQKYFISGLTIGAVKG